MKKIILSMLSVAFIAIATLAQPPHGKRNVDGKKNVCKEGLKKQHKPRFGKELNLSEQQRENAKEIAKSFHEKVKLLKSNDNITIGDFKKSLAKLEKERKEKFEAILTAEQKSKMAEMKMRRENDRKVHGAARLERMKLDLNLTEVQADKIKKLHEEYDNKIKSVRENDNYSSMEKKEKTRELMNEQKENINKILTKEQQVKFAQKRKGTIKNRPKAEK